MCYIIKIMLHQVRRFFAPPIFEEPEKTRIARILNASGWISGAIILAITWSRAAAAESLNDASRYTLPLVLVILVVMQALIRMGYVRFAGGFTISLIWLLMTYQAAQADGLWDVALLSHLAIIILAALLLGWREGVLVGVCTLIVVWYFAFHEYQGTREFTIDPPLSFARDLTAVF